MFVLKTFYTIEKISKVNKYFYTVKSILQYLLIAIIQGLFFSIKDMDKNKVDVFVL